MLPEPFWGDVLTAPAWGGAPHLMPQEPEAVSPQGCVLPGQVLIHMGTGLCGPAGTSGQGPYTCGPGRAGWPHCGGGEDMMGGGKYGARGFIQSPFLNLPDYVPRYLLGFQTRKPGSEQGWELPRAHSLWWQN